MGRACDPEQRFGRVDWVTKRRLIAAADRPPAERKKIDLKYRELGAGYCARLEGAGLAPVLVTDAALTARRQPPSDSLASLRGRVMRELAGAAKVRMSWDRVKVGGRSRPRDPARRPSLTAGRAPPRAVE